jgi:transposase
VSRQSVAKFCKRFEDTGLIGASFGGGRKSKFTQEHLDFIDSKMEENNELTGPQL